MHTLHSTRKTMENELERHNKLRWHINFIKFKKVSSYGLQNLAAEETKANLAKEVLAEIPDQLISYMKSKQIEPLSLPPPRMYPKIGSICDNEYAADSVISNEIYSSDDEWCTVLSIVMFLGIKNIFAYNNQTFNSVLCVCTPIAQILNI